MNFINIVFICVSIAIIRTTRAETMHPDWMFYSRGCDVSTASEPENYSTLHISVMTFGANPKCTIEYTDILERYCLHELSAETNEYDLSKPIQGVGHPKSYGQVTCDRLKEKDVNTTLILTVAYGCIGPESGQKAEFSYDALKKIDKKVSVNCKNGTFVA